MDLRRLPFRNLLRHPGRTLLLAALVALLACAAFGGSLVLASLRTGLGSLERRLGADVIVVPQSARSTTDLEELMISGTPGSFYMDKAYVDAVAGIEGVERVSPQNYLATVKAGCCTMPVQVIGFDPATDFSIQPWIARSYARDLGAGDVVVGCNVSGAVGSEIMLYGVRCRIVAKLDETGTALDNAVFTTADTLKTLIAGSVEQGISVLADHEPDDVVSTVQVKVAPGYDAAAVTDYVNLHVRGATAVQARAMTAGVASSMAAVSGVIGALAVALWVLAAVVLVVAFALLGRQRAREFAVLRVAGASRAALAGVVVVEAAVVSAAGAALGVALAGAAVALFSGALETALGLPFLAPPALRAAAFAALALVGSLVVGCAASLVSALRLARVDAGQTLREE